MKTRLDHYRASRQELLAAVSKAHQEVTDAFEANDVEGMHIWGSRHEQAQNALAEWEREHGADFKRLEEQTRRVAG